MTGREVDQADLNERICFVGVVKEVYSGTSKNGNDSPFFFSKYIPFFKRTIFILSFQYLKTKGPVPIGFLEKSVFETTSSGTTEKYFIVSEFKKEE